MIAVLIFFTFNFDQISIFFVIKLVSPKVAFQAKSPPVEAKFPTEPITAAPWMLV